MGSSTMPGTVPTSSDAQTGYGAEPEFNQIYAELYRELRRLAMSFRQSRERRGEEECSHETSG